MTEKYTVTYDEKDRPWDRNQRAEASFDAALRLVEQDLISTEDTVVDITARGGTYYYDEIEVTIE